VTSRAKRRAMAAAIVCGVAIVAIVVLAFQLAGNITYFRTVSEAVEKRSSEGDHRIRLAGEVVPESIQETRNGVTFEVTDGKATVEVVHQGDPPGLFKGGAPVVCEGRWGDGPRFESDRILIKHGEEYEPPEVDSQNASASVTAG
jgi:cytochrome c-type biogenesis protein CcmE